MPLPASDSEMGTLRHKNGKPVKSKRAGKKPAAASSRAGQKAESQSGTAQESSATKATESAPPAAPTKRKRRRAGQTPAGASTAAMGKPIEAGSGQGTTPPSLSTGTGGSASQNPAEHEPAGPALPGLAGAVSGERRRWSDRPGPAINVSDAKRSESGDSGETPPRTNKLVPTNAVHPTERRIKRRMHKNGALLAAAGAALLGVLILSNQSEPPELVLNDRQMASRLPAGQDWLSDATATVSEAASRARVPDSDSPRVTAPTPPEIENQQLGAQAPLMADTAELSTAELSTAELSTGDIVEMERMLGRLDLAAGAPDGIIDDDTAQAIRLYQQIAGLPVDGEASQDLLADMREVVKILDSSN